MQEMNTTQVDCCKKKNSKNKIKLETQTTSEK
jgi:hypothetical protein